MGSMILDYGLKIEKSKKKIEMLLVENNVEQIANEIESIEFKLNVLSTISHYKERYEKMKRSFEEFKNNNNL